MSLLSTTTTRARVLKKIIDQDGYNILWSEAKAGIDLWSMKFMFKSTAQYDVKDALYMTGVQDPIDEFNRNVEVNHSIRVGVTTTAMDHTPCLIVQHVHRVSNELTSTKCYTCYLQDASKYALITIDYDANIVSGSYLTSTFDLWDVETMEDEDKAYYVVARPTTSTAPATMPVLIERLGGGGGGGGTAEEITVVTGVTGSYCTGAGVSSDGRTLTLTFDNATTTTVTKNFLVEDE